MYRHLQWGDRKHWQLDIGRLNAERWCSGAPCHHLPRGRHWVRLRLRNAAWPEAGR
jgi:hypothetical protein